MFTNNIYYTDEPLLTPQFCNDLIHTFEDDPNKKKGRIKWTDQYNRVSHIESDTKKSTDLHLSDHIEKYDQYHRTMLDALTKGLTQYANLMKTDRIEYDFFRHDTDITGFKVQRTEPGEYFHWHTDYVHKKRYQAIAYIYYLNDVYEGGRTEFTCGTIIQPKQGHLLLFPSTWDRVHRGVSPTLHNKYIVTGWWRTTGIVGHEVTQE